MSGTAVDTIDGSATPIQEPDPVEVMQRTAQTASTLKQFVEQQGLTTKISRRDYLLVEAWQALGMIIGVTPAAVSAEPVENGWKARAELHDRTGRLVGSGESECLRSESTWKDRDDYALKSMAQTRAIGKAYRNTFGFIAKAAGFEPTPAEEMGSANSGPAHGPEVSVELEKPAKQACTAIAGDAERAVKLWKQLLDRFGGYMPHAAALTLVDAAGAIASKRNSDG